MKVLLKSSAMLVILAMCCQARAGGMCISIASGNWSDASTWSCSASSTPTASDAVSIENGHTVTLDVDAEVAMIEVLVGGDFDVGNSVDGFSLTSNTGPIDLEEANVGLSGDFTVNSGTGDIALGEVVGPFSLVLNSDGQTFLSGAVDIKHLVTDDGPGSDATIVASSIFVSENGRGSGPAGITLNDPVMMVGAQSFFSQGDAPIILNNSVDISGGANGIIINIESSDSDITLGDVGTTAPPDTLGVTAGGNIFVNGDITTIGDQLLTGSIVQNDDVVYTGSGILLVGDINAAEHDVSLMFETLPDMPSQLLVNNANDLTVGIPLLRNRGGFEAHIDGDISVSGTQTYNYSVIVEENATITGNNLIFNESVSASTCGLTLQLDTLNNGMTAFSNLNGEGMDLDVVTNSDGTIVLGGFVTFNSMIFNGAAVLVADTIMSATGNCNARGLVFNNTIDGEFSLIMDAAAATSIVFNDVVGGDSTLSQLVVNEPAVTQVNADLSVLGVMTFTGRVIQAGSITYTADRVNFFDAFDAANNNAHVVINAKSFIDLNGPVGGGMPFSSLQTSAAAFGFVDTKAVNTTGLQSYLGPVGFQVSTTLNAGALSFASDVGINAELTLNITSIGTASTRINGNGGITKTGPGILNLLDTNTYTGETVVNAGTLLVDGATSEFSPVLVNAGRVGGNGLIAGSVEVGAGTVTPGSGIGILETGGLFLDTDSGFDAEVDGINPGLEHDQIIVDGTVTLNGGLLSLTGNYIPEGLNSMIVLIDNDGSDPVAGEFAGLAEGSFVNNNGPLRLTYMGGDGNDVALIDDEALFADSFEAVN